MNVVQNMAVTNDRRARARAARRDAVTEAALAIVTAEGLDALTMARLATALDCAVGTLYGSFPSKGALVAAVQTEAIDRLTEAYLEFRDAFDDDDDAVVRLVGVTRHWLDATARHPQETKLLEMLMASSGVMDADEVASVVPSALRLLGEVDAALRSAAVDRVLDDGDAFERTVIWAAALNGVLQAARLTGVDAELFDAERLTRRLTVDLLVGWGAERRSVVAADAKAWKESRR